LPEGQEKEVKIKTGTGIETEIGNKKNKILATLKNLITKN